MGGLNGDRWQWLSLSDDCCFSPQKPTYTLHYRVLHKISKGSPIISSCEQKAKFPLIHTHLHTYMFKLPLPPQTSTPSSAGIMTGILKSLAPACQLSSATSTQKPQVQSYLWLLPPAIQVLLLDVGFTVASTQLLVVSLLLTIHSSSAMLSSFHTHSEPQAKSYFKISF